jgi:8-amino-7-oxononanoate synthase
MNRFSLLEELQAGLQKLDEHQLRRHRRVLESAQGARVQVDGRALLNFCSNDYRGLANHPALRQAAGQAIERFGVGSGAAHLVCGHQAPHEQFEADFAAWIGLPAALLFSTGYMANLGVITALLGRGDAVFADKLNHASLNDACQLSRATFHRFAHNDMAALERLLAASTARRKLIAVDAVFSMDGDLAPLDGLLALAERHDAWLYLDDAHGFGVLGRGKGCLAHWQLASPRIIYMATLGKAAGSAGAVVAAEATVIEWLQNKARTAVYTTALPAALSAAASRALVLMDSDQAGLARLDANIATVRARLTGSRFQLLDSPTAIQPVSVDSNEMALTLSRRLMERGFWVAAIRPPTVPTPRLRITLSAAHSADEVDALLDCLLGMQ